MWTLGESWHNRHHAFPYDYRSSELEGLDTFFTHFTTRFITYCGKVGLAYDLKTTSPETVAKRIERTGDGTF